MKRAILDELLAARAARKPVALITHLKSGAQRIVSRAEAGADPLAAKLAEAFRFDQSFVTSDAAGDEFFVNIHNPPLGLIIIGAVHIAQAVIPMAEALGYDITVIDPRGAFATPERFPGVTLAAEWPDEVIPKLTLDARTALLALTHDPKIDDPALIAALKSELFYIGALGSKKTHASRVARLTEAGFDAAGIARIHAPIGLDLGARGAQEIALSIMAQVTAVLRKGAGAETSR